MIFNSIEFAIFLPVTFVLYWFLFNKSLKLQNLFIVLVSYIFYGFWDFRLLGILFGVSALSWVLGNLIYRYKNESRKGHWLSILNILLSVSLLFVFKYYNFFSETLARYFHYGNSNQILLNLIVPVGMSFYLFKSMSYTLDIYWGKIKPEENVVNYLAYISFFPQIFAGPIERPGNLLPQFSVKRKFDYALAADGGRQILWGLFKKCVVAGSCALYVDRIFDVYRDMNSSTLACAVVVYAFQIYADFSGYSDMAIGVAKLFGFKTNVNFNLPYFSRNIAEFWRKWHISLTSWFTDYVYIPLGGNRCTKIRVIFNTFIVFLASGLWHGANWTFVAWGGYHAALFIPLIVFGKRIKYREVVAASGCLPSVREFFQMLSVFVLTLPGWILFRAKNLHQAVEYMASICNSSFFSMPWLISKGYYLPMIFSVLLMAVVEWRHRTDASNFSPLIRNRYLRYSAYVMLCALTGFFFFYHLNTGDNFIYMNF